MLSWLSSLFSRCEKKGRKKHVHLTREQKSNLTTDININQMSFREVAHKYFITEQTARNHYKKAMDKRNEVRRVQQ